MSGTLFGLPLSQRVDLNGQPSVGWKLYIYQANTSTPVNSYQDTALTILNSWPIVADAYGMMGAFWLADGSYRARGTSADGSLTYFDQLNILALTPAPAPSGGPATPVDTTSTAIFQTGDVMWLDRSGTRAGWVRDNGRTIGSATSGGTERANADCEALFEFLWNNFSDTFCPVLGGRGGSAVGDWGLGKSIATPDKRGCAAMGADQMGGSPSGHFSSVPVISGSIDTPGSTVGGNMYQLLTADLPAHTHAATAIVTDPGHQHNPPNIGNATNNGAATVIAITGYTAGQNAGFFTSTDPAGISVAVTNANAGSDGFHNNTQRNIIGTYYRKL